MRIRTSGVIPLLMGLVIATACGSSNPAVATGSPTPSAGAIVDDHFGFIVGNAVRPESVTKPVFVLPIPEDTAGVARRTAGIWLTSETMTCASLISRRTLSRGRSSPFRARREVRISRGQATVLVSSLA